MSAAAFVTTPYSAATRWREGGGTGRPSAVASSIHAATASCTDASAASGVSPSDMQPGRSGTSATKPPPSSSGSGSMITGYSSLGMARVLHQFDEPNQSADVDWLGSGWSEYHVVKGRKPSNATHRRSAGCSGRHARDTEPPRLQCSNRQRDWPACDQDATGPLGSPRSFHWPGFSLILPCVTNRHQLSKDIYGSLDGRPQFGCAAGWAGAAPTPVDGKTASIAAEQILRNTRGVEDEVARSLKLAAQRMQIDIEQPPLPLAHFAGDDHGLHIGAIHQ
jgi:hypothetical protein